MNSMYVQTQVSNQNSLYTRTAPCWPTAMLTLLRVTEINVPLEEAVKYWDYVASMGTGFKPKQCIWNDVRREASRHFGKKEKERLKGNIEELETNSEIKNIRDCYLGASITFRRGTSRVLF